MKNRTAIGIVCIILAVAVTFVVSPLVNNISDKKTEVVRFVADVSHGTEIKDTDVEIVKISNSALPEKVIKDKKSVVGKFATADIFKGDFATESKVTDNANTANDVMASLKGDKVAMSITINSFAGGLSGKLENGDIVSIYVTDKDNHTEVPASLKYVKVITTTTSGGIDENDVLKVDGNLALAWSKSLEFTVERSGKTLVGSAASGEGLVNVYRGTGKVLIAPIDKVMPYTMN